MPVPVQMTQTCPPTNQPRHPPTHQGLCFLSQTKKLQAYRQLASFTPNSILWLLFIYLGFQEKNGISRRRRAFLLLLFAPTLHKTHKKRMCKHQSLKSTTAVLLLPFTCIRGLRSIWHHIQLILLVTTTICSCSTPTPPHPTHNRFQLSQNLSLT